MTRTEAYEQMQKCIDEPGKHLDDPLTKEAAKILYADPRQHQCYWNNRFAVAVMCGMSERHQRAAAWCVVDTGTRGYGYFEWVTHDGYDMVKVLKYLKIVGEDFEAPERTRDLRYCWIPDKIKEALVEKFRLPPTFVKYDELTQAERAEYNELNDVRTDPGSI